MNNTGVSAKKELIPPNPLIKKLLNVESTENVTATYGGIYQKTLFFLAMTAVGVLMSVFFGNSGAIAVDPFTNELFVDRIVVIMLLVAAGIFLVFPFLAFIIRATIPVTGSLYCVSVGFLFSFFAVLDAELGSYIVLALVLTLTVVAVMGYLFSKGIIRVTAKLRAITTTSLMVMVTGGLLLIVCSYVPFLRESIMFFTNNPILYLLGSVAGIIIAVLFLLVDFDNIRSVVENQLPKKYEWFASFGLVFTVVWVYLKILHLVLQFKDGTD